MTEAQGSLPLLWRPRVFTIAPDEPFLPRLAAAVGRGVLFPGRPAPGPLELAQATILLPTRRSARALSHAFLDLFGGASLLPRIRPLGDVDEDEFAFEADGEGGGDLDLPPAISGLGRQLVLMRLLLDWAREYPTHHLGRALRSGPGQAVALARSLAALVQSFETEEVALDALEMLREGDYPEHRAGLLDFLSMVRQRLPEEMGRLGIIGQQQRRSLLIAAEARRLEALGADGGPIIAAGSTGSIPATARLLSVIARLPHGAVVLPGLDASLDAESWAELPPQHPQYGLKRLLERMGLARHEVEPLPGGDSADREERGRAKQRFLSEVMRPAATTERWRDLPMQMPHEQLRLATEGVALIEAPSQREEALIIALIMRHVLEAPEQTGALITPDRRLARRVAAELARWDIAVDDTGGTPVAHVAEGTFLLHLLDAVMAEFGPVPLLALLKHPLAAFGFERAELRRRARLLELVALRGLRPPPGLDGIAQALHNARVAPRRTAPSGLTAKDWRDLDHLVDRVNAALQPLIAAFGAGAAPIHDLTKAHLEAAEAACLRDRHGSALWRGENGQALAALFSGLIEDSAVGPEIEPTLYPPLLRDLMMSRVVRPQASRHPRLAIYGLLEARLIKADVTILGGLNEGVWPGVPQEDPWLNRPMRQAVGLDMPERRLGLAAHDFVQAMSGGRVYGTWSRKIDGAPAVPSRWILRLQTLLQAGGAAALVAPKQPWLAWASQLERPPEQDVVAVPKPRPPLAMRPRRLSVTEIETWIRDPYAIFARHVLRLRPLDELEKLPGPAERGILVHAALQRFAEAWPEQLPEDPASALIDCGRAVFADWMAYPDVSGFWWPQFLKMARWFAHEEVALRRGVLRQLVELKGRILIDQFGTPFELTGRGDRFDLLEDGTVRIIDYKTGSLPTHKQEAANFSPQLLLEAKMVELGGFEALGARPVRELAYIRLTGGNPAGVLQPSGADADLISVIYAGLCNLIAAYDDEAQPYLPRVRIQREDAVLDYDHLSRFAEWQALAAANGESNGEGT
ncbi:double-strand break repair protein AddB [Rhodoligotrophos defluvii]|uniref:double-strand break repair protein AddB n=1 Tax=Rhodoligotrophos defluvii TaxID=2561934 RepID=UPI001484E1A6|nr:double-strand break repair protein AddB [Rhodoligotrophos defluvii]